MDCGRSEARCEADAEPERESEVDTTRPSSKEATFATASDFDPDRGARCLRRPGLRIRQPFVHPSGSVALILPVRWQIVVGVPRPTRPRADHPSSQIPDPLSTRSRELTTSDQAAECIKKDHDAS